MTPFEKRLAEMNATQSTWNASNPSQSQNLAIANPIQQTSAAGQANSGIDWSLKGAGTGNVDPSTKQFLDWQISQPSQYGGPTVGDMWKQQGIDPTSDYAVKYAKSQMALGDKRMQNFANAGVPASAVQSNVTPWGNGSNLGMGTSSVSNGGNTSPTSEPSQVGQFQNSTLNPYTKSPYVDQMAQGITSQMNDNWNRNLAPSIRSGAMAAGGFGGSRQGVVEANGLNDMNRSLGQNLTNLYNSDYQSQMGRNLQQYQGDQSYNLGLAGNQLGWGNLNANINNSNNNNQLNWANFGLNAYNTQQQGNQNAINQSGNMYNQPINNWNTFSGGANQAGGMGGSNSQTNQGNPYLGALAGWNLGTGVTKVA